MLFTLFRLSVITNNITDSVIVYTRCLLIAVPVALLVVAVLTFLHFSFIFLAVVAAYNSMVRC